VERIGLAHSAPPPGTQRTLPIRQSQERPGETEKKAIAAVIAYERARGCNIEDVQDPKNLGFDLRSLHPMYRRTSPD
jgi:hypothetical protein